MAKNVLLLGNGFDLSCGIKSKFSDYLNFVIGSSWISQHNKGKKTHTVETCHDNIRKILIAFANEKILSDPSFCNEKMFDWIQKNYFNFLFLYYGYKNEIYWFDVENILKQFILDSNLKKFDIFVDNLLDDLNDYDEKFASYDDFLNRVKNTIEKLYKENQNKWTEWLEKALNLFESDFLDYIRRLTTDYTGFHYLRMAQLKMNQIFKSIFGTGVKLNSTDLYLINFNYSNPCKLRGERVDENEYIWEQRNITNVHGGGIETYRECIVGIDDSNFNLNIKEEFIQIFKFSKTYRRLKLHFTDFNLPSKTEKINIIFFGLSLSQNDYSYYQSLFDKYDIYNNKDVNIIFCYSSNFENYGAAYKLLKTYGQTLDNKDHGNNLITLLGLEQRLKFINIDEQNWY